MTLRIVVTGAAGLVGRAVVDSCRGDDVAAFTHADLDIADPIAVSHSLAMCRPEIVVNAAAVAGVDQAESDPDVAWRVNAVGPGVLAAACRRLGAALVHLSTDYVFAGDGAAPYTEWDATGPANVYGRSKLGGEVEVRRANAEHYIVRTSWVFGRAGGAAQRMIDAYAADGEIRAWSDQWNVPTPVDALAATIRRLGVSGRFGTYHVCGRGKTTRYDFAREVVAAAGGDPDRVVATTTLREPGPTPRPTDTELDTLALRLNGFDEPGDWRPALQGAVRGLL